MTPEEVTRAARMYSDVYFGYFDPLWSRIVYRVTGGADEGAMWSTSVYYSNPFAGKADAEEYVANAGLWLSRVNTLISDSANWAVIPADLKNWLSREVDAQVTRRSFFIDRGVGIKDPTDVFASTLPAEVVKEVEKRGKEASDISLRDLVYIAIALALLGVFVKWG